ncbi:MULTISPECIES: hypothetical protein [unclassified Nocardioides]|uniref:hypothetical protein n=1 Tax=unclassified Nocardioides TaxID=2615069 RepID=UPI00361B8AEF
MSRAVRPGWLVTVVAIPALLASGATATPTADERRPARLVVDGATVAGLHPGERDRLTVTVRNRAGRTVEVTSVTAGVRTTPRGCAASLLRIGSATPGTRLRSGRTLRVRLPIRLAKSAPDACQGVRFQLTLRARARR